MEGKVNINFQVIEVMDPFILFITDASNWAYTKDNPAFIEIRLPASRKVNRYTWKKDSSNLFNSHNLNITCLKGDCNDEEYKELPDGIYEIKVFSEIEGLNKTKLHLRTSLFEIDYYKTLINLGEYESLSSSLKNSFIQLKYTLERAKAYTLIGDELSAAKYFKFSQEQLDKFKCKKC